MELERKKRVRRRMLATGAIVTVSCVSLSLFLVHIAFALLGASGYWSSMLAGFVVPMLIAPISVWWFARVNWKLEEKKAMLENIAHTDQLTGLANRRAALAKLAAWRDAGCNISVSIADIDRFKSINDRFGHETGDLALVHFADALTRGSGADWLVARLGGEEFLIASCSVDPVVFELQCDAIRLQIATMGFIAPQASLTMTACFGVAHGAAGEKFEYVLKRADEALYEAKHDGRNRTVTRVA